MSEEEIIGRLHGLLVTTFHYSGHTENGVFWEHSIYFPKDEKFYAEAIQGLLDLYNKKNKELEKKIILDSKPFVLGMISKDEIREFLLNKIRYRQFELQQEYKDFKDDIKLNTLQDIFYELLEEDNK